jgi:hypothetical protein
VRFASLSAVADAVATVREQGFIQTTRSGPTGVGMTLEHELGIPENNDGTGDLLVDTERVELKTIRHGATNPVTLFCKEPPTQMRSLWGQRLVERYGYIDADNRQSLYSTVTGVQTNAHGFTLQVSDRAVRLVHETDGCCARWPRSTLRTTLTEKLGTLILVTAHARGRGEEERFWYVDARYLTSVDETALPLAIESGALTLDLRMHLGDGIRNHGSAWRLPPTSFATLFETDEDLFECTDADLQSTTGQQTLDSFGIQLPP